MKVLISAYACEPGKGSEPGVGWNAVLQAASRHEVWVITRASNRPLIDAFVEEHPLPNVHWAFFDLPRWARFWKKGTRGVQLYYYVWQVGAARIARKLQARIGFDLVHHATFANYWLPSFMPSLRIPFVWGPVGGAENAPRAFYSTFSARGRLYEHARDFARSLANRDPFVRAAARRATVALAATTDTANALRGLGARRTALLSQVTLTAAEQAQLERIPFREVGPFRVLSIGNLLHLKGYHLALEAFARARADGAAGEYWIIGDGPERARLEALSRRLGVASAVRFLGRLERSETLDRLADCDVLLHPSLHDSASFACVEAMAAGRPVLCLDLGGPGFIVDDDSGVRVEAGKPDQTIRELANALVSLARHTDLRRRLSCGGRARSRAAFGWDAKARLLDEIYLQAVSGTECIGRRS